MNENLTDFVEKTYRAEYENGRLNAGYEAALFCIANGEVIPDWLAPMIEEALRRDFLTSEGRGRGGLPAIKASRKSAIGSFILTEVDRLNSLGTPKSKAFEKVACDLSSHDAKFWTSEMVKAEYYRNR